MPKKQFAVLLAAVLVSGLLGGAFMAWWQSYAHAAPSQASSRTIIASEFNLVDKSGRVRAQLAFRQVQGALQPGFFLYGPDGKERAGLTLLGSDSNPALALSGPTGDTRLWLGLNATGAPQTVLYDDGRRVRAALGAVTLQGTGGPRKLPVSSFILSDENGKLIWQAP
jgi:hypothetical protein